ncbi:chemotaxis protein CheW [Photobacterium leiognathi]|uniref:chemotaxis protein CheW n=1 Tax=Photobacterium leiognathi TaxID=553611 RepID=UPI00273866CF|nr:chemotaxis protein CheW [Photobacterium leiognathi]
MHSKPLSSDQALDDYFFDLLEESNDAAVSTEVQDSALHIDRPDIEQVEVATPAILPKMKSVQANKQLETEYVEPTKLQDIERLLSRVDEIDIGDIQQNVEPIANQPQIKQEQPQIVAEELTSIKELNEPEIAQVEVVVETPIETPTVETELAPSASLIPPEQWTHHGTEQAFQALFFEVNGVMFAVALTELGGIHQLAELNRLLGRPSWYLGLQSSRDQKLDVVDTARWVMPEKLVDDEHRENYRYIVMLGESHWGLASDKLHGTKVLDVDDIRWREKAGKRPWLAGMVKDKMCALIHVNALIAMLNNGLDVNSIE